MPVIDSTPKSPTGAARRRGAVGVRALAAALAVACSLLLASAAQGASHCTKGTLVLRVGTFNREKGQCATIREAEPPVKKTVPGPMPSAIRMPCVAPRNRVVL